ncbi:MAG: AAA family ATPase, partial [SAR324 cluster bacterium]|nr:AAA family ATPase [SAR324 cluster bacterium]
MVFVGGPRQVGKTTLALNLLNTKSEDHPGYINWDIISDKQVILRGDLPGGQNLIVLDEIHKYKEWRNLIKGFFDQYKSKKKFLITGSARLDYYRRGGDSLQGRYHYH